MRPAVLPLLLLLALPSCKHYATAKRIEPPAAPSATCARAGDARSLVHRAWLARHHAPGKALGDALAGTRMLYHGLVATPQDPRTREAYNHAVARVIDILQLCPSGPWAKPLAIDSPDGPLRLSHANKRGHAWDPARFTLVPADEFAIDGTYVKERRTKPGIGAALVAIGKDTNPPESFLPPRTYYGVTALLTFQGNEATLTIHDPLSAESVRVAGKSLPLAADFTAPLAVMLDATNPERLELSRLLRPARYAHTARITRLQPYDPEKTVVLVVHGLMDTPATWTPMLLALRADPYIRKHYQFWFYSYPSGYPYQYSASILRQKLDEIGKVYPPGRDMVVIGHSMGGCISRLLITDTGETIWKQTFGRSYDKTLLSPEVKRLLHDALIFDHRPEVGRVIFIATPLRGSHLASSWLGRLGTRFVRIINTIPVVDRIPHHVICGDRGKGGNKDKTKPQMSDGIVPYWSSHMPTAQSEKIVPSGHSAHQHPEAIQEVLRILR